MSTLKITQIGDSLCLILLPEALALLNVKVGDSVCLTNAPSGYRLTPHDPVFEDQMRRAEEIMEEHHDVLRALAD